MPQLNVDCPQLCRNCRERSLPLSFFFRPACFSRQKSPASALTRVIVDARLPPYGGFRSPRFEWRGIYNPALFTRCTQTLAVIDRIARKLDRRVYSHTSVLGISLIRWTCRPGWAGMLKLAHLSNYHYQRIIPQYRAPPCSKLIQGWFIYIKGEFIYSTFVTTNLLPRAKARGVTLSLTTFTCCVLSLRSLSVYEDTGSDKYEVDRRACQQHYVDTRVLTSCSDFSCAVERSWSRHIWRVRKSCRNLASKNPERVYLRIGESPQHRLQNYSPSFSFGRSPRSLLSSLSPSSNIRSLVGAGPRSGDICTHCSACSWTWTASCALFERFLRSRFRHNPLQP